MWNPSYLPVVFHGMNAHCVKCAKANVKEQSITNRSNALLRALLNSLIGKKITLPSNGFTCVKEKFAKIFNHVAGIWEKWRTCSKNLRFWVEKGKIGLHKLTKIYWKQYLHEQLRLIALLLSLLRELILGPRFRRSSCFYLFLVFSHAWIPLFANGFFSGGKRASANPAGV